MLSLLHHQNLVNLIGYCADGEQRLLVYEFMPLGSVENHLLDIEPNQKPLDWFTRMKIASGAAQGLEYLHVKANPPVIYRDLKASSILVDENFNPRLSDFGLAKLGPVGDKMHVSSRVMGTYGYCAPEYARTGHLTVKSDVYSFGVVLLELITGRRVIDNTRPAEEQNLVTWAQPIFRDPRRFPEMADRSLGSDIPERGLNQAVAIAAMCLQEEASARPLISDVVAALSFLSVPCSFPDQKVSNDQNANESRSDKDTIPNQSNLNQNHMLNNQNYDILDLKGEYSASHPNEDSSSRHDDSSDDDEDEVGTNLPEVASDHQGGDGANRQTSVTFNHRDSENSEPEYGESANDQDEDSSNHQEDGTNSDYQDGYNSDYQDRTRSEETQNGDSSFSLQVEEVIEHEDKAYHYHSDSADSGDWNSQRYRVDGGDSVHKNGDSSDSESSTSSDSNHDQD